MATTLVRTGKRHQRREPPEKVPRRVLLPTSRAFREAGKVTAELAIPARDRLQRMPASFVTDILLAVSCREDGITLVTRDADLVAIARHVPGLKFVPPWP